MSEIHSWETSERQAVTPERGLSIARGVPSLNKARRLSAKTVKTLILLDYLCAPKIHADS